MLFHDVVNLWLKGWGCFVGIEAECTVYGKNMKNICLSLLVALFGMTFSYSVNAIESKSGVIKSVEVFGEGNYAFRIRFQGATIMCSLNEAWAYIESTDSNYKTKVSTLLTAFSMGATVRIYTEATSRNHCHLRDIVSVTR